ncbi:MAG: DUF4837 family protein [Bacteroidales bacterium]|nr:DUF4837 family protein [Bacteroidales bacterium]
MSVNPGSGSGGRVLPNITGAAGEVLVVMDSFNWQNSAGDLLQDVLKEEIPGLPQSEPMFDVIHITAASFDNLYQFHRSIVMTVIRSGLEPRIRFRENVWARPQIVIQLEAATGAEMHKLIEQNDDKIQGFLIQYDRKRVMESYAESKDLNIQKELAANHQIRLAVPRGYNLDFSNEDYTSLSIESPEYSQVLQIFEFSAESDADLNIKNLIEKRDLFTKKYVVGPNEQSYMIVAPIYPPIGFDLKSNNLDVLEIRGLWELEKGFMGGPFVSHSVYDESRKRIVTVDGYVYFPNEKKRTKLRQLEAIIYSLEII